MTFREEFKIYQSRYPKKRAAIDGTKILFRWHHDAKAARKKAVIFPGETGMMDITYRLFNGLAHCFDVLTFELPRSENDRKVVDTLIRKTVGTPDIIVGFGLAGILAGQYFADQVLPKSTFVTDSASYLWLKGDDKTRQSARRMASDVSTGVMLAKNLPRVLLAGRGKKLFFSYIGKCTETEKIYLEDMYDGLTATVEVADLTAQTKVIYETLTTTGDFSPMIANNRFLVFADKGAEIRTVQQDGKAIVPFYDYKGVLLKSRDYFTAMIDRLS